MMVHYILMVMLNLASIHVDMDEVKNLKILKLFLTAKWLKNSKKYLKKIHNYYIFRNKTNNLYVLLIT